VPTSEPDNHDKASAPLPVRNADTNHEPLSPETRHAGPVSLAGTGATTASVYRQLDVIELSSRQLRVVVFPRLRPFKVEQIRTVREAVIFSLQMCEVWPIVTFYVPLFSQRSHSLFYLCMTTKFPYTRMSCITIYGRPRSDSIGSVWTAKSIVASSFVDQNGLHMTLRSHTMEAPGSSRAIGTEPDTSRCYFVKPTGQSTSQHASNGHCDACRSHVLCLGRLLNSPHFKQVSIACLRFVFEADSDRRCSLDSVPSTMI
jgi:hypothetical protein